MRELHCMTNVTKNQEVKLSLELEKKSHLSSTSHKTSENKSDHLQGQPRTQSMNQSPGSQSLAWKN